MAKVNAIGIDLGSPRSCVGIFQNGKVVIIGSAENNEEETDSMILTKMKEIAAPHYGNVDHAVVAVSVNVYNQREEFKVNGLKILDVVNKPAAAAVAYRLDKKGVDERNVLVFDLGCGALDVSILTIKDSEFIVKSNAVDIQLGSDAFHNCMVNHFAAEFKRKHNTNLASNPTALRRLQTACERASRTFSTESEATISLSSICDTLDLKSTITLARFDELCAGLFQYLMNPVKKVICDAKIDKCQIHDIVLVGGSTHIPKVQTLLSDFFPGKEINNSINPDEVVAYGAAIMAAELSGS